MKEVFIVSVARTPIGSFGGKLAELSAVQLGTHAVKSALQKINLDPEFVQELIFGNVVSANVGQAPARQIALAAGLNESTICTTVNKVCASGMKAAMYGAQSILLNDADIVVVGGTESMSQAPFYIPKARFGYKYGDAALIDGLSRDGLVNPYDNKAMGEFADKTAEKYEISRAAQDEFAINSYKRSAAATENGKFKNEIIPIEITTRKGVVTISEDEEFRNVMFDKIPTLKSAFPSKGTVTAANASTMNDGAAALILASGEAVKEHNLKPIARIISFADGEIAPEWFTMAPTIAAPKALKKSGLTLDQMDFIEVNEAFAVVPLAFAKELNADLSKMNVYGGGVSLGHPLGCSGARIIVTLTSVLQNEGGKYGLAAICNGGGGASAMIIERI